jgi:gluconokinase
MAAGTDVKLHIIVIMGVAGAGKTTVGEALAASLGWQFHDADDFHSAGNIEKMHRGEGLSDADRESWLAALAALAAQLMRQEERAVIACSALKHAYRERLRDAAPGTDAMKFVYLDVPVAVLRERLAQRSHHFAPPALLESQLTTLEPPQDAYRVDGTRPVDAIVREVRAAFNI